MNTPESVYIERCKSLRERCSRYVLKVLSEQPDGAMLERNVMRNISHYLDLDDWEVDMLNDGVPRWITDELIKTNYLTIDGDVWSITERGRQACL